MGSDAVGASVGPGRSGDAAAHLLELATRNADALIDDARDEAERILKRARATAADR